MTDDREERDLLLNAYFDGELDAVAAPAFRGPARGRARSRGGPRAIEAAPRQAARRHCRGRPARNLAPRHRPPFCHAGVEAPAVLASARRLTLVVGIALGSVGTFGLLPPRPVDTTADQVVASHIRALMAPSPADVASSDHHTVKPWFDGKVAFAPQVVELLRPASRWSAAASTSSGFEPVPALVYRAGKHLISLVEMPSDGAGARR